MPDLTSIAAHSRFHCGPAGLAYNETAFRHFLNVDRSRAQRAGRFLYLVLVAMRESIGRRARLSDATASAVFRGLGAAVREVDFVGWFHEGRVAAAVLSQGAKTTDHVASVVAERILAALRSELSGPQASRVRLRVIRLGGGAINLTS